MGEGASAGDAGAWTGVSFPREGSDFTGNRAGLVRHQESTEGAASLFKISMIQDDSGSPHTHFLAARDVRERDICGSTYVDLQCTGHTCRKGDPQVGSAGSAP